MHRILLPLLALVLLSGLLVACSELDKGEVAQLTCVGDCNFLFEAPSPSMLTQTREVRLRNDGGADARISDLRINNTSQFIGFGDATRIAVVNQSNQEWSPEYNADGRLTGFNTGGQDLILSPNAILVLELQIAIPRGQSVNPQCPGGNQLECGTLQVVTSGSGVAGGTINVPISIGGDAGRIQVNPTQVVFADGVANVPQQTQFTVQNIGGGTLALEAVRLAAPDDRITIQETSNVQLPRNMTSDAIFTYNVTWTPRADNLDLDASIIVESDDATNPTLSIPVTAGASGAPELLLTDQNEAPLRSIDFPPLDDGRSVFNFNVRNGGDRQLTFTFNFFNVVPSEAQGDLRVADAEGLTVGSSQQALLPDATRGYQVIYQPDTGGAVSAVTGTLRISANDPARTRVDLPFSAGDAVPLFDISDNELRWGQIEDNTPSPREILLFNNGRAALDITAMTLDGDHADLFSVTPDAPLSIGPRSSELVTVTYQRESAPVLSSHTATLTITTSDERRPSTDVVLIGLGTSAGNTLPPTCVIGVSASEPYNVGDVVTLDANGSESNSDPPELNVNQSRWLATRPDGGRATIGSQSGATTTLALDEQGTWTVFLTVVEREAETRCQRQLFVQQP